MLSRLAVNFATLVWGLVVLFRTQSLLIGQYGALYKMMLDLAPQEVWGSSAVFCSSIGIYRIVAGSRPHWIGAIGYIVMLILWQFLAWGFLFGFQGALPPSAVAGVFTVSALAFHAVVSGTRHDEHSRHK